MFRAGDEHFSAGDECVENECFKLQTHKTSYQRLLNKTYVDMIASHSYSPLKTGDSYMYHAAEIQRLSRCTMVSSAALK